MKKKLFGLSGLLMGLPMLAFAQTTGTFVRCVNAPAGTIDAILCRIGDILNFLVPILIALGVVYFVWGVITYVIADDEEAKKAGRDRMIFGIIGLLVIIAVWGLVKIVMRTFGISSGGENITYPTVPY